MSPARYHCRRCRCPQAPEQVDGRDKVRGFRSGYVARFLVCGHSVAVTDPPVDTGAVA